MQAMLVIFIAVAALFSFDTKDAEVMWMQAIRDSLMNKIRMLDMASPPHPTLYFGDWGHMSERGETLFVDSVDMAKSVACIKRHIFPA